jgi:hypothetical protein
MLSQLSELVGCGRYNVCVSHTTNCKTRSLIAGYYEAFGSCLVCEIVCLVILVHLYAVYFHSTPPTKPRYEIGFGCPCAEGFPVARNLRFSE